MLLGLNYNVIGTCYCLSVQGWSYKQNFYVSLTGIIV